MSELEELQIRYERETACMRQRIDQLQTENERLRRQNDALILDIAFFDKQVTFKPSGETNA
jgi:hypothetical protein